MRRAIWLVFVAAVCLAQTGDWKTAATLPGVDLSGLTKAQKDTTLAILRTELCTCGCNQMIAECRMKDQSCANSRRLAAFLVREVAAGKNMEQSRASLKQFAGQPPPIFEPPVKLSIDGDPIRGVPTAKVTIVEFSDFQCPYCALATGEMAQLLKKFPKDLRLVFKQFPLDIHSQAALAAEASLAAQAQGKFWELHDKMYANYRTINRTRILAWAKETGLDMNRFQSELDGHKYAARVQAEEKQGDDAGVEGTPTFFIDGKRYNGEFDADTLAPLIADELKH